MTDETDRLVLVALPQDADGLELALEDVPGALAAERTEVVVERVGPGASVPRSGQAVELPETDAAQAAEVAFDEIGERMMPATPSSAARM